MMNAFGFVVAELPPEYVAVNSKHCSFGGCHDACHRRTSSKRTFTIVSMEFG